MLTFFLFIILTLTQTDNFMLNEEIIKYLYSIKYKVHSCNSQHIKNLIINQKILGA